MTDLSYAQPCACQKVESMLIENNSPMKILILILTLGLTLQAHAFDKEIVTREYAIEGCIPEWPTSEAELREFLLKNGVQLGGGDGIKFAASPRYVFINTTNENHQMIKLFINSSTKITVVKKAIQEIIKKDEAILSNGKGVLELMALKPGVALLDARTQLAQQLESIKSTGEVAKAANLEKELIVLDEALKRAIEVQLDAMRKFDEILNSIDMQKNEATGKK